MDRAVPEFTEQEIKLIVASLPVTAIKPRVKQLGKILREWCHTDLGDHWARETRAMLRARRKQLVTVGKRAQELLEAIEALDRRGHTAIALEIKTLATEQDLIDTNDEFTRRKKQWSEGCDFLRSLAEAAPKALRKPTRGRPRNLVAYLVMKDIAAIFEWLTDTDATRIVDREENNETGPFWHFSASLWPVIFGKGDDGLSAALKNWATARRQYDEESPFIQNINLKHPEWGVFER